MDTIKNPLAMWKSDNIEDKKTIIFMYFDERPEYDLRKGFGTAGLAYPIQLMKECEASKIHLVEMAGIEPASELNSYKNFFCKH